MIMMINNYDNDNDEKVKTQYNIKGNSMMSKRIVKNAVT